MRDDFFLKISHVPLNCFLIVMTVVFFMAGNSLVSLTHPDEVFYAQTAKEMIKYHSWMTPYLFDAPQFEKPIFFYWLLISAFHWLGVTASAARFWPALFGGLGVFVTYWLTFMIFRNKRTALFAGMILCTSFLYLGLSRAVLTDMVFSVWVVLSLSAFYYGYRACPGRRGPARDNRHKRTGILLCGIFSGLAVLTKGFLGFLLPIGVILLFLISERNLAYLKDRVWIGGLILFVVVSLPWHMVMMNLYGNRFLDEYFMNVHLRRIFEAEHRNFNTWYFYLLVTFGGMLPWSFFLMPAFTYPMKNFQNSAAERRGVVFLFIWVAFTYIIFQSAQSKLASYILPLWPALAIVIASYFNHILERSRDSSRVRSFEVAAWASLVAFVLIAIGGIVFLRTSVEMAFSPQKIYILFGLMLLCWTAIFLFIKTNRYLEIIFSINLMTGVVLTALFLTSSYIEPWVSCKGIAGILKTKVGLSDSTILVSKPYVRGIRFYTDQKIAAFDINGKGFFSPHPIPFVNTDQKLFMLLESQPVTYCVVHESGLADLQRILPASHFRRDDLNKIEDKYLLRIEQIK